MVRQRWTRSDVEKKCPKQASPSWDSSSLPVGPTGNNAQGTTVSESKAGPPATQPASAVKTAGDAELGMAAPTEGVLN
jgi:hypothetical protein